MEERELPGAIRSLNAAMEDAIRGVVTAELALDWLARIATRSDETAYEKLRAEMEAEIARRTGERKAYYDSLSTDAADED